MGIIPEPVKLNSFTGKFNITDKTEIYAENILLDVSKYLKKLILSSTGISLKIREPEETNTHDKNTINLQVIEDKTKIGSEGYVLNINPEQINISAINSAGAFYAIQTLRQLLPPEIERNNHVENLNWEVPCLKIIDYPRFSWRGYMLDEARFFQGKAVVKKLLSLMALLKLNRFHWHLTDDQGWRIQIKKYPRLIEVGSKREETQVGGLLSKKTDGIPHKGYYTQEDIQEIVDYAKARFIIVIPEIDIPGHTQALLASYPDLSCRGYPLKVSSQWRLHKDVLCVGKESVFEILQDVLNEIINLFPSKIIHIGGDEVPRDRWKECPNCQNRLKREGIEDEDALLTYFINKISNYLQSLGIQVICWNDVLADNLNENIICQYWCRQKRRFIEYLKKGGEIENSNRVINHMKRGGEVINSAFKYTYLDHSYSFTSLKNAYNFEPIPQNLEKEYHKYVLGLEAPMWSSYTPNIKRIEWQTFPRLIAFAEIGWTPRRKKNYLNFLARLQNLFKRLDIIGVNYASSKEFEGNLIKRLFKVLTLLKEPTGGN